MENKEINLKLTVAEINIILQHLGTGAYQSVFQLVNSIQLQSQKQLAVIDKKVKEVPSK